MKKDTKGKRTLCRNFLICHGLRVPSMPHTEKKPSVLLNRGLLLLPGGHFIKIFEQKSSIANRNPYSGFALSAMMESRYWRGVNPVCLRNTR